MQANVVILTNNNPRGEDPAAILADIIAGYPDKLLEHNARVPYQPGFLQDPGRLPFEALEFAWQNCFECVSPGICLVACSHSPSA